MFTLSDTHSHSNATNFGLYQQYNGEKQCVLLFVHRFERNCRIQGVNKIRWKIKMLIKLDEN